MFKFKGRQINAELDQTVIHATLRLQDLVPAFLEVLKDVPEYPKIKGWFPDEALENDEHPFWDSDDCHFDYEMLFWSLEQNAPEGYYFGTTEGNGSDFGFWRVPEDEL